MENGKTAVEVKDLRKTYRGKVEAVRGISFTVAEREIFALLGPNGAGKSTTVKILVTLSAPTGGSVRVAGIDALRNPQQVRRKIGYVSQSSTVDLLATGRENLALQGHLYHLPGKALATRVEELIGLFGLSESADRIAQTYSGGMRRRLDVAMGLIHRPQILILDEPTTALDPESRAVLWRELRRLSNEDGLTILFTTHYLEEADREAARVAIIDQGRVVATGAPAELKNRLRGDVVTVELAPGGMIESGAEALRRVEGVASVLSDGQRLHAQVANGARQVPAIVGALEGAGLPVAEVTVTRASLDEVYLSVTGRRFAEADAPAASARP
jgi:ABC-2 type transport system ATP-binding protein